MFFAKKKPNQKIEEVDMTLSPSDLLGEILPQTIVQRKAYLKQQYVREFKEIKVITKIKFHIKEYNISKIYKNAYIIIEPTGYEATMGISYSIKIGEKNNNSDFMEIIINNLIEDIGKLSKNEILINIQPSNSINGTISIKF